VLWEGFVDIPFLLLWACVDHPELTVHSEMQLCNALLRWYENQTEELRLAELTKHLREHYTSIFKKVNHLSHALFCCFEGLTVSDLANTALH
jgi:hypothetical protein